MNPLIINLAPTGMVPTSSMTPHVPLTKERIVEDVSRCAEVGATMFHLHARDPDESPTYHASKYAEIINAIRDTTPDAVLIASTSGRTHGAFEQRADVLGLPKDSRPEMASLTLGSMNFRNQASQNSPDMVERLAARMAEQQIKPELEIFDLGMINVAHYLIAHGLIHPPYYFNIILGNFQGAQVKSSHLGAIVAELPDNSIWSVGGIGRFQNRSILLGISEGHGVRVGLEDNLWLDDGRTRLATNLALVKQVRTITDAIDRPIASIAETRTMLGLDAKWYQ